MNFKHSNCYVKQRFDDYSAFKIMYVTMWLKIVLKS